MVWCYKDNKVVVYFLPLMVFFLGVLIFLECYEKL